MTGVDMGVGVGVCVCVGGGGGGRMWDGCGGKTQWSRQFCVIRELMNVSFQMNIIS